MTKKLLLIVVFLFPFLVAARCNGTKIEDGMLRDTIFSVEQHYNGSYSVWFTHDDVIGYCTGDAELGKEALSILKEHDGEVVATYRDINAMSDEEASFWQVSDCGTLVEGSGVMILTSIVRSNSR